MDRRVIKVRTDPSRDECLSAIKMTLIRFNAFVQELDRQNYYSPGKFTAEHRDFLYEMTGRQYLGNMNAVLMGKQLEELDDEALKTVLEKCRRLSDGFGLCVDIPKEVRVAEFLFTIDEKNRIIKVYIGNIKDIKKAAKFLKRNSNYKVQALDKNGDGVEFSNYKDIESYLKIIDGKEYDFKSILNTFGNISLIISDISKEKYPKFGNTLEKTSTLLGWVVAGIDFIDWWNHKDLNITIDLLISCIGLVPGSGGYISMGLSLAKYGIIEASTAMAKIQYRYDRYIVNKFFHDLFGIDIKI